MVPAAERGLPVEVTGRKWGRRRQEQVLGHAPSGAVRIIAAKNKSALELPLFAERLDGEADRPAALRVSPLGEIIVSRWREPLVVEEEGRRWLVDEDDYVQLRRPRERRVNFAKLPERPIVELVPMVVGGLEPAIRQQIHIQERYQTGGNEAQQIEAVMNQIEFQLETVLKGGVSKQSLFQSASEVLQFLEKSGLTRAKKTAKRNIAEALIQATQPDSRGRVNPLVMRIRLRQAYLEAARQEILSVLINEKFRAFLGLLLMEREFTRRVLRGVTEDLDTMIGFTKRGAAAFSEGLVFTEYQSDKKGINSVLFAMRGPLDSIRVAPYLAPARLAIINLFGCHTDEREANREIIGEEVAERLYSWKPVVNLVDEGLFPIVKMRIGEYSYGPLMRALEENREIGIEIE